MKKCIDCTFFECDNKANDFNENECFCKNDESSRLLITKDDEICEYYEHNPNIKKHIKKDYELNKRINIDRLKSSGFVITNQKKNTLIYNSVLFQNITIHIEIEMIDIRTFDFNEITNISIIDSLYPRPYMDFYYFNESSEFLNNVIDNYNKLMDYFVKKGVFQEKKPKLSLKRILIK